MAWQQNNLTMDVLASVACLERLSCKGWACYVGAGGLRWWLLAGILRGNNVRDACARGSLTSLVGVGVFSIF